MYRLTDLLQIIAVILVLEIIKCNLVDNMVCNMVSTLLKKCSC